MGWLTKFNILRHTDLHGNARIEFPNNTSARFDKGSRIIVEKGIFRFGHHIGDQFYSSLNRPHISLGKNARLTIEDDVLIGPGCSIAVRDNCEVRFKGHTYVGPNFFLLCNRYIEIGKYCRFSWNCQLLDSDCHPMEGRNGKVIERRIRPLIIKNNVSFTMGIMIPEGIVVEENACIGAGCVLRKNIPANCLVRQEVNLTVSNSVRSPKWWKDEAKVF